MSAYQKYKMVPLSVYADLTNEVQTLANARAKIYRVLDSSKLSAADKVSLFDDLLSKARAFSSQGTPPIVKTVDTVVPPPVEILSPPKKIRVRRVPKEEKQSRPVDNDPQEVPVEKSRKRGREKKTEQGEKKEMSEKRPKRTLKPISHYGWGRKKDIKVVYWRR